MWCQSRDDGAVPDAYLTSVFYQGYWGATQVKSCRCVLRGMPAFVCLFFTVCARRRAVVVVRPYVNPVIQ